MAHLASPESRARLNQRNFIKETVQKTETNFETLCGLFGAVNRKNSYLRDKFDEIAKTYVKYANTENGTFKTSLNSLAEHISAIQDYRQAEMDRLDAKVVQEFKKYSVECKNTKADLQRTLKLQTQHDKKLARLEKMRRAGPTQQQSIERAKTELERAEMEANLGAKALEQTCDKFETKKINDFKNIMHSFLEVEMLFHSKALERYTQAMKDLDTMDIDDHLQTFRNTLQLNTAPANRQNIIQEMQPHGGGNYPTNQAALLDNTRGNINQQDNGTDEYSDDYGDEYEEEEEHTEDEDEYSAHDLPQPQQRSTRMRPF